MSAAWTSLIAVAGTVSGGMLTGLWTARTSRAQRREARRTETVRATGELVAALAAHRTAMWVLGEATLGGHAEEVVTQRQDAVHRTRAAVTAPMVTLSVLTPALVPAARAAEQATYALRTADSLDVLGQRRAAALAASDALVTEAGLLLADRDTPTTHGEITPAVAERH